MNNLFFCPKCKEWYQTIAARDMCQCGSLKAKEAKSAIQEEKKVEDEKEVKVDLTRDELKKALKESGVRISGRESDEKLKALYAENVGK